MNNNFEKFYSNYSNKLKESEKKIEIDNFLSGLQNLYPLAEKLFQQDTEKAILDNINVEKFKKIEKHVFENVLPSLDRYDIFFNKVTLVEQGKKTEHILTNPIQFINKYLSVTETTPYYYLILSYMLVPKNYDIVQLCDK